MHYTCEEGEMPEGGLPVLQIGDTISEAAWGGDDTHWKVVMAFHPEGLDPVYVFDVGPWEGRTLYLATCGLSGDVLGCAANDYTPEGALALELARVSKHADRLLNSHYPVADSK